MDRLAVGPSPIRRSQVNLMDIPRDIRLEADDGRLILRPPDLADAEAIYQAVDVSRAELTPWMDPVT